MQNLDQLITEAEALVQEAISQSTVRGLSSHLMGKFLAEKVVGTSDGKVARVDMEKDCPSAARERIAIAAETAKANEANMKVQQDSLAIQIKTAKDRGDTELAANLEKRLAKVKEFRQTNLKNIDAIDSISSVYAEKYKPSNDKYDQRAHSMFLQQQRKRLEDRLKEQEGSSVPNPEALEKLQRRLGRIDTAQRASDSWLNKNDPAWLKASREGFKDYKTAMADENKRFKEFEAERAAAKKAAEAAAKEAVKTEKSGTTAPATGTTPAPAPSGVTGGGGGTTATTGGATGAPAGAGGAEAKKGFASQRAMQAKPGEVWQTKSGFGAKNQSGTVGSVKGVRYFSDEGDAKKFTRVGTEDMPRRRAPDRKPVASKAKKPIKRTPEPVRAAAKAQTGAKTGASKAKKRKPRGMAESILHDKLNLLKEAHMSDELNEGKTKRENKAKLRAWKDEEFLKGLEAGKKPSELLGKPKPKKPQTVKEEDISEEKDACYEKIMRSYGKWSARAAQATAKCRKEKGDVRVGKAGANLKRWGDEKWVDTKSGKPCGAGGDTEYCRPSVRVSSETPKTKGEMSKSELKRKKAEKSRVGMQGAEGRKVSPVTNESKQWKGSEAEARLKKSKADYETHSAQIKKPVPPDRRSTHPQARQDIKSGKMYWADRKEGFDALVQSILSKTLNEKKSDEQVLEFDLEGKALYEIAAFLRREGIEYTVEDGVIWVEDDMDEDLDMPDGESLQEASARRKIVVRKGKKRIIFKCPPGKKKVGVRTCIVRKSSDLMKMKRRAKRGARKARTKKSRANRLRKRSVARRKSMGLNKRRR